MNETQYAKIINLYDHADWVCQADFWNISKSPHKRRADLEKRGYRFEGRPCEHGIRASKDFKLHNIGLAARIPEQLFIQATQPSLGLSAARLTNYH